MLSSVLKRPMNQLLNDAVAQYLRQQTPQEIALQESLEMLRSYREKDPGYTQAINDFVEAEVTNPDPAEGSAIEGKFIDGRLVRESDRSLRRLLDA